MCGKNMKPECWIDHENRPTIRHRASGASQATSSARALQSQAVEKALVALIEASPSRKRFRRITAVSKCLSNHPTHARGKHSGCLWQSRSCCTRPCCPFACLHPALRHDARRMRTRSHPRASMSLFPNPTQWYRGCQKCQRCQRNNPNPRRSAWYKKSPALLFPNKPGPLPSARRWTSFSMNWQRRPNLRQPPRCRSGQ